MRTFSMESNGRIEKTALYLNGEQIAGVKELLLHIDEDGVFDAIISYEGSDGQRRTKQLFTDHLEKLKVIPPVFTEEEARLLQLLSVESNGEVDDTVLYLNDEPLEGVVDILVHIKTAEQASGMLASLVKGKDAHGENNVFRAEVTFRNEDETIETERIFV